MNTDAELIDRIFHHDSTAFELLFKRYYRSLCHFSIFQVKNAMVAEEIVQDIFCHLWETRNHLNSVNSIKSYLFKAVYNNSIKYLQHQKVKDTHVKELLGNHDSNVVYQDNAVEMGEIIHIIQMTLDNVSERTRTIFYLNREKGLKYQEVADKLIFP